MTFDTEGELRKKVEARLGFSVSDGRWSECLSEHAPHGPWGGADMTALLKALRTPGDRRRILFDRAALETDMRFALPEVQRLVRECRQYLFSDTDPPFSDRTTAAEWIRERARQENEAAERTPGFDFPEEIAESATFVILAYPGREAMERVRIPALGPLAALASAGRMIAAATLCEAYQAVGHVLTGTPVLIWPVKVTETTGWGEILHPKRVTLEVNFDWITKADIADFYEDARVPAGPLSKKACLAFFNKQISGTPAERLSAWNRQYPHWTYPTVGAFKTAISRATGRRELK